MPTPRTELKNVSWYVPLIKTTQDKSTPRVGVMPEKVHQLAGIDGSVHGGLRPVSGFTKVLELDWFDNAGHDLTSRVLDWEPTSFRIGSDAYGYGIVYKASRAVVTGPTPPTIQYTGAASWTFPTDFVQMTVPQMSQGDILLATCVVEAADVLITNAVYNSLDALQVMDRVVGTPNTAEHDMVTFKLNEPELAGGTIKFYFTSTANHIQVMIHVVKGASQNNPIHYSIGHVASNDPDPAISVDSGDANYLVIPFYYTHVANITDHVPVTSGMTEVREAQSEGKRFSSHVITTIGTGTYSPEVRHTGFATGDDTWMTCVVVRYVTTPAGYAGRGIGAPGTSVGFGGSFAQEDATYPSVINLSEGVPWDEGGTLPYVSGSGTDEPAIIIWISVIGDTASNSQVQQIQRMGQNFQRIDSACVNHLEWRLECWWRPNALDQPLPGPENAPEVTVTFGGEPLGHILYSGQIVYNATLEDSDAQFEPNANSSSVLMNIPFPVEEALLSYAGAVSPTPALAGTAISTLETNFGDNESTFGVVRINKSLPIGGEGPPWFMSISSGHGVDTFYNDGANTIRALCGPQSQDHAVSCVLFRGPGPAQPGEYSTTSTSTSTSSSTSTSTSTSSSSTSQSTSTSTSTSSTSFSTSTSTSTSSSTSTSTSSSTSSSTSTSTSSSTSASQTDYDLADIFIDYWNSDTETWTHGYPIMYGVDPNAQMSVSEFGRLVYVFVEGRDPALFYLKDNFPDSSVDTWTEVVVGQTDAGPFPGPGIRPQLVNTGTFYGGARSIPSKTAIPNGAPLYAQVILSTHDITKWGLDVPSSSASTPSTASSWVDEAGHNLLTPWQILNLERIGQERLENGDYSFMCFLYDTRTGRKSQPSEIAGINENEFFVTLNQSSSSSEGWDRVFVDRYAYIEGLYDSDLFDQLWVYRSVKAVDAVEGGGVNQLWLDGIVDLDTIHTIANDRAGAPAAPLKHFFYPCRLSDLQITLQLPYVALTVYDRGMPKGGASIIYENMMIVGKVTGSSTKELNIDAANTGLGEIRWSDATELSPELFPPLNRYVPTVPSNETIQFERVGDNVVGYANDRLYHIRKESQYVNIEEMHEGYGVTGHRATAALGSLSLYLNHRGVKQVAANGKLDDVRAIDHLVIGEWGQTAGQASLAFDPVGGVVFVYNPTNGTSACFWVNTGVVSELHDLPFHGCRQGVWPSNALEYDDTLVRRALWLQNSPYNPTVDDAAGFKPKIYLLDIYREKVIQGSSSSVANGQPRLRLLDVQKDGTGIVHTDYEAGTPLRLYGVSYDEAGLIGARVYSARTDGAGVSARIIKVEVSVPNNYTDVTIHPNDVDELDDLVAGDSVMLSPVPVEIVAHPLRMEAGGQGFADTFEYVTVRQMETMGISLADVSGPLISSEQNIARWEAQLYEGNNAEPTLSLYPTDKRGDDVFSLAAGESTLYASFGQHGKLGTALSPGVRIIVPDVDFKLLGFNITGTIRASVKGSFNP